MANGGGKATGGSGTGAGSKPLAATPGREGARFVPRNGPSPAAERLMARQDRAITHPETAPARAQGPARVTSTDWVEQDRQARQAQAARSAAGLPMPAPGGTVMTQPGPTPSEAQTIDAMRARLAKLWSVPGEALHSAGVETRQGHLRAWTAELPGRARGREEEREP